VKLCPYKRGFGEVFTSFHHVKVQLEESHLQTRWFRGLSLNPRYANTLTLHLPASRTMRNKCFFLNRSAYRNLLQQSGMTKILSLFSAQFCCHSKTAPKKKKSIKIFPSISKWVGKAFWRADNIFKSHLYHW
jgi:hypothetical protein